MYSVFFFFNDTATTEIYTLSLHDALPILTVIVVDAEPERAFEAVNVTLYVPACVLDGVHENVPEVFAAFFVNVAPAGRPAAVRLVMASPSGSEAVTTKVISVFSAPEAVAGATTTGARSTLVTVIVVDAEPLSAFEAVNVTLYVPDCAEVGVQLKVPEVFAAFFVNVAPAGRGAATRFVIASPSGSEAVTTKVISVFSAPESAARPTTAGARSTLVTVIVVDAEPERAFEAVNVTLYVPDCVLDGVHENVPEVFAAFFVNVAPAGRGAATRFVIASPSGSDADTVKVISVFSAPEAVASLPAALAISTLVTVIVVDAEPLSAFDAVNVTLYVPDCVLDGVHEKVPEVFAAFFVNVAPAGRGAATRFVIASPSGSEADTVKVISVPSAPEAVAGATTTGARSTLVTVIVVDAEPERAFEAVNVTLYVPACVRDGVHENVPEVFAAFFVNVAPAGRGAATRLVMASPSGSTADTVKRSEECCEAEAFAGATTTGGRSPSVIVISVVAEPERAFEAVKVTLYVPDCVLVGVHEKVPEVFAAFFVNVAPAGRGAATRLVIASPSGSTADTVNVSRTFVGPLTDHGAVTS